MVKTLKTIILILVIFFLTTCEEREISNPFDPNCPKEIFTPTNFIAVQNGDIVSLTWEQPNDLISGFKIERKVDTGSWSILSEPSKNVTDFDDPDLTGGKTHQYRITALAGNNASNAIETHVIPILNADIITSPVNSISETSAKCGGKIVNDGGASITVCGVVWSTISTPTVENNEGRTENVLGDGNFASQLNNLQKGFRYYVRAYAINSKGTAYGNEFSFIAAYGANSIEYVMITGGNFIMGSNDLNTDAKPAHSVTLNDFLISKYEVTNDQFIEFLNDINCNSDGSFNDIEFDNVKYIDISSGGCAIGYLNGKFFFRGSNFAPTPDCPVIKVTWHGANAFSKWAEGHLPTEAEWEFAARGGLYSQDYIYSGSNDLNKVAWYKGNSGMKTHPVGEKQPNELGIYDMSGNVSEWCADWYSLYDSQSKTNPNGPDTGIYKVLRGNGYASISDHYHVTTRISGASPNQSGLDIGFRLAHKIN